MSFVTRGFKGRRRDEAPSDRVPPGQYVTTDFPVLSAGPTPRIPLEDWRLTLMTQEGDSTMWTWEEFRALPVEAVTVDIHCVTKWSKLDTVWEGVSIDTLLASVDRPSGYALVRSYGGYTTNVPVADMVDGKAWVAFAYGGEPLAPEHGGPARLLVPHLYFWKSAKWVQEIELAEADRPGFWESYGYHIYGDPWREQRYSGD
ncbi:MAG TPA: sulfite oxidase-like oxidoreductase [Acidimicrobiia bacterium]|nr:sulfite oxidase-like oxidoreductase [Acidimicrobiia bacterium]